MARNKFNLTVLVKVEKTILFLKGTLVCVSVFDHFFLVCFLWPGDFYIYSSEKDL